jgi:hypothetical protein
LIGVECGNQSTDEPSDDDEEDEKHGPRLATYESDCNGEVDDSDGKGTTKLYNLYQSHVFLFP